MAISQSEIDALERALVSGHLSFRVGDRQYQYRSIDEIERALAYARRRRLGGSSAAAGPRHQLADFGE